jgi:Family of unknown function (DUF5670)
MWDNLPGGKRLRPRRTRRRSSLQENSPPPAKRTAQITVIKPTETKYMLYTLAVVLLILWLLGIVSSYTMGGFIHILLVVAVVMILVNLISGRRRLL